MAPIQAMHFNFSNRTHFLSIFLYRFFFFLFAAIFSVANRFSTFPVSYSIGSATIAVAATAHTRALKQCNNYFLFKIYFPTKILLFFRSSFIWCNFCSTICAHSKPKHHPHMNAVNAEANASRDKCALFIFIHQFESEKQ